MEKGHPRPAPVVKGDEAGCDVWVVEAREAAGIERGGSFLRDGGRTSWRPSDQSSPNDDRIEKTLSQPRQQNDPPADTMAPVAPHCVAAVTTAPSVID